jgi:hypothetical protein
MNLELGPGLAREWLFWTAVVRRTPMFGRGFH